MPFVAAGNFMTAAFVPFIAAIPKIAVEPNCVPWDVSPPLPSAYCKSVPTVALRLPLSKFHKPNGWACILAETARMAIVIAMRRRGVRVVFMLVRLRVGLWVAESQKIESNLCQAKSD